MGRAKTLNAEFAKARATPGVTQRLMGFVCAVMVGFILLMSGFTFFFIELSLGEQIVAYAAVILSLWWLVAGDMSFGSCQWFPTGENGRACSCVHRFGVCVFQLFAQIVLPPL